MVESRRFASFEEFWPYYVAMHSKAATRWVHLVGTLTGLAVGAHGLARGRKRRLVALPLIGYGTAWPAHFLIEGNNPATFGHPGWSLRGDARMIGMMLSGRDAELGAIARAWLAEHGGPAEATHADRRTGPLGRQTATSGSGRSASRSLP